jgi:hypothetical protein
MKYDVTSADQRKQNQESIEKSHPLGYQDRDLAQALHDQEIADLKSGSFSVERFSLVLIALRGVEKEWNRSPDYRNRYDDELGRLFDLQRGVKACLSVTQACFLQIESMREPLPAAVRDLAVVVSCRLTELVAKTAGTLYRGSLASDDISAHVIQFAQVVGLPDAPSISGIVERLAVPGLLSPLARYGLWLSLHAHQTAIIRECKSEDEELRGSLHEAAAAYALQAVVAARDLVQSPPIGIRQLLDDRLEKLEKKLTRRGWSHDFSDLVMPPTTGESGLEEKWARGLLLHAVALVVKNSEGAQVEHWAQRALDYVAPIAASLSAAEFSKWLENYKTTAELAGKVGEHDIALEMWQRLEQVFCQKVTEKNWTALEFHQHFSYIFSGARADQVQDFASWLETLPRPWREHDKELLKSKQDTIRKLISGALNSVNVEQHEYFSRANSEWKSLARECWAEGRHSRYIVAESLLDLVQGHLECLPDPSHEQAALHLWRKALRILEKFDREPLTEYLACWVRWTELGSSFENSEIIEEIESAHEGAVWSARCGDLRPCFQETLVQHIQESSSEDALKVMYKKNCTLEQLGDASKTIQAIEQYRVRFDLAELRTQHSFQVSSEWVSIQEILVSTYVQEVSRARGPDDRGRYLQAARVELHRLRDLSESDPMPFLKSASKLYDVIASSDAEEGLSRQALQLWRQIGSEITTYLDAVGKRETTDYAERVLTVLQEWAVRGEKTFEMDCIEEIERRFAHANDQMNSFLVYYDTAEYEVVEFGVEGDDEKFSINEYDDGMTTLSLNMLQSAHVNLLLSLAEVRARIGEGLAGETLDAINAMVALHLKYFPGDRWIEFRINVYEHAIALYDQCHFYSEAAACREELEKLTSGGGAG